MENAVVQYEPCNATQLGTFGDYQLALSSPIDSYLEDHILGSATYRILDGHEEVGCFAIHPGDMLTLFHLQRKHQRFGQAILKDIRQRHNVATALVPTCDEFFLSHVLDSYRELKMQAYFFVDTGNDPAPTGIASDVQYRLAQLADVAAIKATGQDIVDDVADRIARQEVVIGHLDGNPIAVGLIIVSKMFSRQASIGMFTAETYRRRGIATRTIVHIKQLCRAQGIVPVSGCAYGNHASKAALETAGMVSRTRLLRITL